MEGANRRQTTSDRLEAGLAVGEARYPRHLPSIIRGRHDTETLEACPYHLPPKKLGKDDHTIAKACRPISLLATLDKVLESVMAKRVPYAVEAHGLLPSDHIGSPKQRSAEYALVFLQEHIFLGWSCCESCQFRSERSIQRRIQLETIAGYGGKSDSKGPPAMG